MTLVVVFLSMMLIYCQATWINMRLDEEWQCRPVFHPCECQKNQSTTSFFFFFFFREVNAQVLIVVEVMDHYTSAQGRKEAQLQIRFPNSAAIAAECKSKKCHLWMESDLSLIHLQHAMAIVTTTLHIVKFSSLPRLEGSFTSIVCATCQSRTTTRCGRHRIARRRGRCSRCVHTRRVRLEVRSRFKTAPSKCRSSASSPPRADCDLPSVPRSCQSC
jgi:hypothetical protein